uniref:Uncharacterized protein n=1 Tax=Moniliophthora roreri TaxID=221103 RepID=A0A0W0F990_MONRR
METSDELAELFEKSVTIKVWSQDNTNPVIIQTLTSHFPYFSIDFCPKLQDILANSQCSYMSTYSFPEREWQLHDSKTL